MADTEVLERWMPSSLDELIEALQEIQSEALSSGFTFDTVYVDVRDLTLERKTLTDGSAVLNLIVRENR